MSDLIDRQAVISEMKKMYDAAEKWLRDANETEIEARAQSCMSTLIEIKLRIEKMPSAEPEDKCSECDAWNKYKNYPSAELKEGLDKIVTRHEEIGYDKGFRDGYAQAVTDTEPVRKGKWCITPDGKLVCSCCHENPTNRIIVDGNLIYDMTPIRKRMKFCPNCGASMSEGEEDG